MISKNLSKLIRKFKQISTERSKDSASIWDFYIFQNAVLYTCKDMLMILKTYPSFVIEYKFDLKKHTIEIIYYNHGDHMTTGIIAKEIFIKKFLLPKALTREFQKMIDK